MLKRPGVVWYYTIITWMYVAYSFFTLLIVALVRIFLPDTWSEIVSELPSYYAQVLYLDLLLILVVSVSSIIFAIRFFSMKKTCLPWLYTTSVVGIVSSAISQSYTEIVILIIMTLLFRDYVLKKKKGDDLLFQ